MAVLHDRPHVVAVGGPTASGKTALSVGLALAFGGEIVNADSMQIYRGFSVGTAQPTEQERRGVPHHLLNFLPPEQPYSVADYVQAASAQIEQITARGCLPLVVGGTGLYITSLLNGVRFAPEDTDPALRHRLQQQAADQGGQALYERLRIVDPAYAAKVHPHNLPRVIRALELYETTGRKMSDERRAARPEQTPYRALCLCLTCRDRSVLYRRIDKRVDDMMQNGLLGEAEQVWKNREYYKTAAQAIGYKELFPYFDGVRPLQDCVSALKQATRRYAKRQLTWFRHQNDAVWLCIDEENLQERACELVRRFLQD